MAVIDIVVFGREPLADEPRPPIRDGEDAVEGAVHLDTVEFRLVALQHFLGGEDDLRVVAGEVDNSVGRVEVGVLEGSHRRWCRQVDGLGERPVEPLEVRRRISHRKEETVVPAPIGVFETSERPFDLFAVAVGRPTAAVVIHQKQDVVARRDHVAVLVGREGVVPGVLTGRERRQVRRPLWYVGTTEPVQTGRKRGRPPIATADLVNARREIPRSRSSDIGLARDERGMCVLVRTSNPVSNHRVAQYANPVTTR
nr:hypothetical protein [Halorientalis litorea]